MSGLVADARSLGKMCLGSIPSPIPAPLVQSLGFFTPWWVWDTVVWLTMRLSFPTLQGWETVYISDNSIKNFGVYV